MTTPTTNIISLIIIIIILMIASSAQNANSTVVSLTKLCNNTRNPTLCHRVLPGSTGDLRELGRKAVKSTLSSTTQALAKVRALIKAEKDPNLIESYNSCSINFEIVSSNISDYSRLLIASKKPDRRLLCILASEAEMGMEACNYLMMFALPPAKPPTEPAKLAAVCDHIEQLASILLAIGNILAAGT
ncbi:hypothetical protein CASFOL_030190 [Castilleja foliolosa]|uniref:Pectinesterase inhibitor domain-containing protein n=1 Tax=Castilleja foliolosa TaxID=1961234 RepID=A0ABD3CBC2_9LAMI